MTGISKKWISWILGVFACVAVAFGIIAARPQTKTASAADTAVTFSAAYLGDASHDTYGTSIRFDTSGLQWETYHNWVTASDWASIADYTTVNGRTVTEINNATTNEQKITLMMQPADSFSFLRLYIPAEIIPLGEVKAMGILDGWSFNNGTNNYTTSATTFYRSGDVMYETSVYNSSTPRLEASAITIGEAQLVNPSNATWGTDSYTVNIDIGQQIAGEYDTMYSSYKTIRNSIYINGKSIEEWNAQKIAEDSRFSDPSMYTRFPQNSTDASHADVFIKPVGLWGTSTGFRLSIFQELVADCETVTVTVGQGCYYSGKFMVMDNKSATVLTQTVVDITNDLNIQDMGTSDVGTENYRIKTSSIAWTKSPLGGCLNEFDPSAAGGGQIQMKYLYFGETSFWDINKDDQEAYGSEQDNIANVGGIYAPILVEMGQSSSGYSYVQVRLPSGYPDTSASADANHTSFTVKKGFNVAENGVSYYVKNDVVFTNNNGTWTKEVKGVEIATEVTGIVTKANRTDGYNNENFVIFQLSNNDYAGLNTIAITDFSSLYGYIDIGGNVVSATPGEPYFNVWNIQNSIAFRAPGLDAAALQNVEYITIKAGAKFPSYNTQYNDAPLTYYVTSEDITFVHDVPNDTWTVGETPEEEVTTVDVTDEITFGHQAQQYEGTETYLIKTQNAYWTKNPQGGCLNEYDPESAGGGQEQMKYIYFNGVSLYDINKNESYNASYGSSQGNIVIGGVYAPILATMGLDVTYSYIQIHIPTRFNGEGDGGEGSTANANHQSIELKAGFTVTEDNVTYTVTEDIKWVNLNGSWVNAKNTFAADTVTIGNARLEGTANELYKVDIVSNSWTITCNDYDFMYGNAYATYRQSIFINGVSVYDINNNTDDSAYTYSTFPMTGADDATFAHPILVETHVQDTPTDPNTITLWLHKNYVQYLGDDFTVTLGAGYNAFTGGLALAENVSFVVTLHTVTVDGAVQYVLDGDCAIEPETPVKEMTSTAIYEFDDWYIAGTEEVFGFSTPITADMEIEAHFSWNEVNLITTEVVGITHYLKTSDDNWLAFELTEHDYANAAENYSMGGYDELLRIGFLDKVILKGSIVLGSNTVSEATLMDVYNSYGALEGPLLNFWGDKRFGLRLPVGDGVEEILIKDGCFFPSYAYVAGTTSGVDIRYMVKGDTTYTYSEDMGVFVKQAAMKLDIKMADGASVRLTSDLTTSGLRFETLIAVTDIETLEAARTAGTYDEITFGTLIVPKSYLMGGSFTHEWLTANGKAFLDIKSSAGLDTGFIQGETDGYYSFWGSIVELKTKNYGEYFSGIGYVKLVKGDDVTYVYATYEAKNSRSASFVANAAINDRSATEVQGEYENYITTNSNYSPYTESENIFLTKYLVWTEESAIAAQSLDSLATKGGTQTITPTTQKLAGPYVHLLYTTNVNVWGVFTYTDGSKTANEDFYLQAGTSEHKQYLDIFRYNGVGYGMDTSNLSMTSITFTNAELEEVTTGQVRVIALYSENKTIDTANQEIYLTVAQKDGSSMTVGAHLGLGGSLTYLAKSGVYEGVIGGSSGWKNGTVAISKDASVFDSTNVYKSGSSSSSTSTEAGYYGHATSSLPADGAVNLINNFDAGRQIQQSWYAQVGGSASATDGSNGYTRAYCYTGSTAGQYWPYNPVQAGDVVSNPGQIVDYEINTAKGYIYVKARAMDWAKGYDASTNCANAVEGGVTTKSYVENYYRLNTDGTLVVNNGFIDWNGFTDMELCDWAPTELPAVYPVHTLNYYVSNIDGDGTWTDAIEYNSGLDGWSDGGYHQFTNASQGDTKVEDWFAWANGGDENAFGMGVYIPNVSRYTSGRSYTSTSYYTDTNFQNSNALPVDEYTEWSWSSFKNISMVTEFAQRGNILADKGMMSNMQPIQYTYQSSYVSNTSYTAPGIDFRMEAYVPIEYSYVICVDSVANIRSTFKTIKDNGTVTNAGNGYEKVGLDAWARADKTWTW